MKATLQTLASSSGQKDPGTCYFVAEVHVALLYAASVAPQLV